MTEKDKRMVYHVEQTAEFAVAPSGKDKIQFSKRTIQARPNQNCLEWDRQLSDKEVMQVYKHPVDKAMGPEESIYPNLWEGLHDPFGRGGVWHKVDGEWMRQTK